MKISIDIFLIIFQFGLLLSGCRDTGVDLPIRSDFSITIDEIASIDGIITIHDSSSDSVMVTLTRNGQFLAKNIRMFKKYIFNDTTLQPKHTYIYTAYKVLNGANVDSSLQIQITTMDTTSHDFSWQTYEFGGGDPSIINDVSIINENNIWAVGEIFVRDSAGNNVNPAYGAVHWDGKSWELKRLPTPYAGGSIQYLNPTGIYVVDTNNIWFAIGGVQHYSNGSIQSYWLNPFPGNPSPLFDAGQAVNKIFGASASNIVAVGSHGALASFDGTSWKKLESMSVNDIYDIWGLVNLLDGKSEFYCSVLGDGEDPLSSRILKITDRTKIETIPWQTGWSAFSVWTKSGYPLYVAGSRGGVYDNKLGNWKATDFGSENVIEKIRGNDINDIFVLGEISVVAHYNGSTWRRYYDIAQQGEKYFSLYVTEHVVALVGHKGEKGIITIGKR